MLMMKNATNQKYRRIMLKKKPMLWPLFVLMAIALSALSYAAVRAAKRSFARATKPQQQYISVTARNKEITRVRRGAISPQLRANLKALGDRLEIAGKERLTLVGTVTQNGEAASSFVATL
jgi:hypothetical protein